MCTCHHFLLGLLNVVATCAGATVQVGIDPSKVVITKLRLDKDRKTLLERKKGAKGKDGSKFNEADVDTMENID